MKDKVSQVKTFYDKESEKYVGERYEAETCERYAYASRKLIVLDMLNDRSGNIIDIGCGPGIFAQDLYRMKFRPCFVDLSVEMLRRGMNSVADLGKKSLWINGEIEHLCFRDEAFDNAMAIGVIAYAQDSARMLSEVRRVLRPGGCLVVQCSNVLSPTVNINKVKDWMLGLLGLRKKNYHFDLTSYRFATLKGLLEKAGFEVMAKKSYDFRLPFIEKVSRKVSIQIMKKLHTVLSSSMLFGWLGEGYVVKAVKK